jgi:hypothetical protein
MRRLLGLYEQWLLAVSDERGINEWRGKREASASGLLDAEEGV